ncbi:MAG: hypothetical protein V1492_00990 [Candidatus Micrarchaeota archaeon]
MRVALFLIFLTAAAFALPLDISEQKQTGVDGSWNIQLSGDYDCNRNITIHVATPSGSSISNADVRLFYVGDHPVTLAAGKTDRNGDYFYTIMGNASFATHIFVVTAEKENYRLQEAHFTLPRCDGSRVNSAAANKAKQNASVNKTQQTSNVTKPPPVQNGSVNSSANSTLNNTATQDKPEAKSCLPLFILLCVLAGSRTF